MWVYDSANLKKQYDYFSCKTISAGTSIEESGEWGVGSVGGRVHIEETVDDRDRRSQYELKIDVVFPENPECFILGRDTVSDVCTDLFQKDYKILFYIDSTGCSGCRLKLSEMKQLITETNTMFHGQLGILIFFQPKNKKEMRVLLKEAKFDYPVFID